MFVNLALKTGGHDSQWLDTTEFVYLNGTIVYGPKLPASRERHCMVALNDYEVMIIGASNDPNKRKTITYNHADGSYTDGPDLAENRQVHSVKLGDKECFDKEQIGVKVPFSVTNCQFTSQG